VGKHSLREEEKMKNKRQIVMKSKAGIFVLMLLTGMIPLANFIRPALGQESVVAEMNVANIEGSEPSTLDPARCYDTASAELIMNVYETLISYDKDKVDQFVPMLATEWTISPDGLTYTFKIRGTDGTEPAVKFHDGDTLTTEDVEYSFERTLVLDYYGGPAWMLYGPLFDLGSSRDGSGNIIVTGEQIDNAVTHDDTTVTFHLAIPYPPFLQILSGTWGSVLSKDWCVALGEWPGTWTDWQNYNNPDVSLIDTQYTEAPGPHVNAMCGTGPYYLEYLDHGFQEWVVRKFDDYWHGWPASGSNGFVSSAKVTWHYDWTERRDMFLAGELDSIAVPKANTGEVLGQPNVRCIYPLYQPVCNAMFFNYNISQSSPFMGVPGGLPYGVFDESGIPPDFFNDLDVRKGFAYAINYTQLLLDYFFGEAVQPATPIVSGLPYHNPDQAKYSLNSTEAQEHFQAAWSGQLWQNGFNMTMCYNIGNIMRKAVCEIIKANVESLNPKFHVNVLGLTWTEYNPLRNNGELVQLFGGWLADYFGPHNFAYPFMHSRGNFAYGYCNATVDALVEAGIRELDPEARRQIYYDLQSIYHEECINIPLWQTIQRRFERDCVQGWYCNPVLYGNYFYTQWKEVIPPAVVTPGSNTVDATGTSDTIVLFNATNTGTVTITSHEINSGIKCVTVDTTLNQEQIQWPMEIRIYFTTEDIISAYVEQSTLRMFYWNETANEWVLEPDSGWVTPSDVSGYAGYVWTRVYHLSLFAVFGELNAAPYVNPIQGPTQPVVVTGTTAVSATFTDYMLDTHTAQWDWDDGSTSLGLVTEADGFGTVAGSHVYLTTGTYTVRLTVTDSQGYTKSTEFRHVVVYDPPPIVNPINAPMDPVRVGTSITANATFTDLNSLDVSIAMWDWGDDSTSVGTVNEAQGSGIVAGSHTYTTPGVYTVRLNVTDSDGNVVTTEFHFVVVYDPEGGFVTGGGWINSPVGAYSPDPSLTGKATFGFVSKYLKGAKTPSGQTEFVFKVANLVFHSSTYDWLVVAGARAQYKGTGTINGQGSYGFLLSAIDGQMAGGGGIDKFRIKIWDKASGTIIYDNQMGAAEDADPATQIGGGSIIIHKG